MKLKLRIIDENDESLIKPLWIEAGKQSDGDGGVSWYFSPPRVVSNAPRGEMPTAVGYMLVDERGKPIAQRRFTREFNFPQGRSVRIYCSS